MRALIGLKSIETVHKRLARGFDVMVARTKRICNLMIKENKLFPFFRPGVL